MGPDLLFPDEQKIMRLAFLILFTRTEVHHYTHDRCGNTMRDDQTY